MKHFLLSLSLLACTLTNYAFESASDRELRKQILARMCARDFPRVCTSENAEQLAEIFLLVDELYQWEKMIEESKAPQLKPREQSGDPAAAFAESVRASKTKSKELSTALKRKEEYEKSFLAIREEAKGLPDDQKETFFKQKVAEVFGQTEVPESQPAAPSGWRNIFKRK